MERPKIIFLSSHLSVFRILEFLLWSEFAMPIELSENIRALDQKAFGAIAFEVMEQAFHVHNKLGRFFDEEAYQQELAQRGQAATKQVFKKMPNG